MNKITGSSVPQPPPKSGGKLVGEVVLQDIVERIEWAEGKYGTNLMTNNGRDPLWDAYQEAIDLVMYLRQAIMERDND